MKLPRAILFKKVCPMPWSLRGWRSQFAVRELPVRCGDDRVEQQPRQRTCARAGAKPICLINANYEYSRILLQISIVMMQLRELTGV
jgi:hypothetical protein